MTPSVNDPIIGTLVDSRYLVRERVARGGMATVYRATDKRLGRTVALKVMHAHLAEGTSGQSFVARFRREARAAARVSHPGLVAVYDQGVDGDISYLTLEFVEGSDLRQLLELNGTLSLAEALAITEDILDALAAAHRNGLVHRDVKPENVLLSRENEVKLTDFGLARAVTEVTSTTTGTILGTVAYLAPELVTKGVGDTRTDIYAVGIMLYEMIIGRQPFVGDAPIHIAFQHINNEVPELRSVVDWVPQSVEALVRDFTAKDPDKRPDDATAALRALKSAQSEIKPAILAKRAISFSESHSDSFVEPINLSTEQTAEFSAYSPSAEPDHTESNVDVDDQSAVMLEFADSTNVFQRVKAKSEIPVDSSRESIDALIYATNETIPLDVRSSTRTVALPLGPEAYVARHESSSPSKSESDSTALAQTTTRSAGYGVQDKSLKGPRPKRGKRTVFAVLSVLLLSAAGAGGWYWWSTIGPGSFVTVPSRISGVTTEDALARFAELPLNTKISEAYDDQTPQGEVISAEPQSGERVKKDSTIALLVSLGIKEIEVPDKLTGKTVTAVNSTLADAGFTNVREERSYDTNVKKDVVKALSVKEGVVIAHNAEIVVTVSDGPEPITVPQVIAKKKSEALEILKSYELKVKTKEEFSTSIPKGQVISQDPVQGTAGQRGDSMTIVVSKGPELVDVPDVTGKSIEEARKQLEDLGFAVKENVYLDGFFGLVRFQDVKAGEKAAKGATISLTVF